jgi:predicted RNA-binding Zn ribbon-like protein
MSGKQPRYDIPNVAPEPLAEVQRFVNSANVETGQEWLDRWLRERTIEPTPAHLRRARTVRESLRALMLAHTQRLPYSEQPDLQAASIRARYAINVENNTLVATAPGLDGALGEVLAAMYAALQAGTFSRLKVCRNHHCRWSFYDNSNNGRATWCSMRLCGNRQKTRSYRRRRAGRAADAADQ